ELEEIDHARRFRADLIEVLVGHDHVAPLLELVALDDLRVRHFAIAMRAPALLLDARLTLAMQLVERDRSARLGRWKHLDRDVHQADLQEPFPGRSCSHIALGYRYDACGD